ncbi:MAG TPA: sugar phosphate isomerase/epimerase family protein [Terriglobia bacterium]|nr:sugar phosphate isomerase/epimerase family protein [Terriglobia bacterium]
MSTLSRRKFLADSAVLAATATLGRAAFATNPTADAPPASGPHILFPSEPRERIAVASWPFRAWIESPTNRWARKPDLPGMDIKDFAAMVVGKFNIHNIEPLAEHLRSTDPAYLAEVRAAVDKAGSHVIDLPASGRNSFYDPDTAKRTLAVDSAKKWVDVAVALGSPSARVHVAGVHGVAPDVDRTAESLRQVADYGAQKNLVINLENDDIKTEDAFFLVKVIEKADHPWLHALPDFCNSMLSGNEQFDYDAVTAMFKHAYNICHVKDSEVDGHKVFRVDLAKTFGILKASGYRGYCSMEFEGEGDPYEGTQKLIDATMKYLGP